MSTSQTAAEPENVANAANLGSEMEVDPQTDIPLMRTIKCLKQGCTTDAIRTMNGLATGSAVNQQHRAQYFGVLTNRFEQVSGPLDRRQKEVASVREEWLSKPPTQLAPVDAQIYPLDDGGDEARVSTNKEIRRLKYKGIKARPMASPADWIKTRRRLTSHFSDFSKNEKVKIWTGFVWPQTRFGCPSPSWASLRASSPSSTRRSPT